MKKILLLFQLFCLATSSLKSQDSTATKNTMQWSGYLETYFTYQSDNAKARETPNFLYNHKRANEFNINLAYIKANYDNSKTRANFALMVGTYAQYNLAAEHSLSQHIFEANVGVRLNEKYNVWLDAGVMPSHIGFESAISQDCWALTRSIVAENSPYFESGVKISAANLSRNLNVSFLLLNGWQQIQRPEGMTTPSVGMQLSYKPKDFLTLNYSNFLGSNMPDSLNVFRAYHNFYAIYEPAHRWHFTAGVDVGTDRTPQKNKTWYTYVLITKFLLAAKHRLAFRYEFFDDPNQVILQNTENKPIKINGFSSNYDYFISPQYVFRIEGKLFRSNQIIFDNNTSDKNFLLTTSLSLKF